MQDKRKLASMVERFISHAKVEKESASEAISYVAPHAGYAYSGSVAGYTYKALSMNPDLDIIDTFVIVGPNHTGHGKPLSVSAANWKTPIGIVENDVELADELAWQSNIISIDEDAHEFEHSIEVQLPFLQSVVDRPRCCFIAMGNQSLPYAQRLATAIAQSAQSLKRNITVIASCDFNHYEDAQTAEIKDMAAIKQLEGLEMEKFNSAILENDDSACGYGPITVAGLFAKKRGGRSGLLLKYSNSGEATKDYKSVVAYASIVFA
ncbi:MAG: AmmeMemoRadiSam system protein B [Candidatus Micrarchaeota archaeon]|nr:AmmeMemoRadiSam system protein B [Candidatus Micrarchaeota archaeon]